MYVLVMFVHIRNNTFQSHRREGQGALDLLARKFPFSQVARRDGAFRSLLVRRAGGKRSHRVRDSLREARHVGDVPQSRIARHGAAQAQEDVLKATLEQRHDLGCDLANLSLLDFKNSQLWSRLKQ